MAIHTLLEIGQDDSIPSCQGDNQQLLEILAAFRETGFGLVLQSRVNFAVILEDMSQPGRYRYQIFGDFGLHGHVTMDTLEDVIVKAYHSGYHRIADDQAILDKLMLTPKWKFGMWADVLGRRVRQGLINWKGRFVAKRGLLCPSVKQTVCKN
jgi:hypothetical protein